MTKRVLIADDDDDALSCLANLLTGLGHQVAQASCGAQALEVARQFAPEVVILDLGMSPMDGLSAARALRTLPRACRTPHTIKTRRVGSIFILGRRGSARRLLQLLLVLES